MYKLEFWEKSLKQAKKLSKDKHIKERLTKRFNNLEVQGPKAGKILSHNLYEIKQKSPSLRIYFTVQKSNILIIWIELKKLKKNNLNLFHI